MSYRRKARAETAEADARLLGLFAELVPLANGRLTMELSENAVEKLLETPHLVELASSGEMSLETADRFRHALEAAVIAIPMGVATHAALVTALGELGAKHELL